MSKPAAPVSGKRYYRLPRWLDMGVIVFGIICAFPIVACVAFYAYCLIYYTFFQ